MKVNVFEGARRVSLLLSALAVLIAFGLAANADPYLTSYYRLYEPGGPLIAANSECNSPGAAVDFFQTRTTSGRDVGINMCLVAEQLAMDDGTTQGLIKLPPARDGKSSWAYAGSDAVEQYKRQIEERFVLPPDENRKLDEQLDSKRWESWKSIAIGLAVTLIVFWLAVAAVGWTVRGFLGIPRGMDSRQP